MGSCRFPLSAIGSREPRAKGGEFDLNQFISETSADAFSMPLFIYRCPTTGYRVQGFSADDTSEDRHVYEPMTCPVCHKVHHVNPATGAVLGDKDE